MPVDTKLKHLVPAPARRMLREWQWALMDRVDALQGRNVPPRRMREFVGGGDFEAIGAEFLRYFVEDGKLRPDDAVLDVGCGIGRMALPLTRYLSAKGSYRGFDPSKEGVDWCSTHITPRFPNFQFEYADLYNQFYNPTGIYTPSNFRFPYQDNSFDFVILTSVFTHLFPVDMENYFSEAVRVLRPGGRSFITYFLLNADSRTLIHDGKSSQNFTHELKGCWTTNIENPENALAFDESAIRALYERAGHQIEEIKYGSWCGRQAAHGSYQDIILGVGSW